jgi:hypothetical protein
MPDTILAKLLAKKSQIAKMPESAQRSVWGFAFENGIKPQLTDAIAKGAQLEDVNTSRERFITSMLGKKQTPSAESAVQEPFPGQVTANTVSDLLKSLVAGTAGGVRQASEALTPGPSVMSPMTLGSMVPVNIPKENLVTDAVSAATHPVESMYDSAAQSSPGAASVGAGIGHTVPGLVAFESGTSMIPTLESKAPLLMRGVQQLTRTAAGTAAMNTVTPEETSSLKFGAQVVGFSILDALTHHVLNSRSAKAIADATSKAGATDVSTSVMKQARSVMDTVRGWLGKKGLPLNRTTLQVFDDAFMKKLSVENPEAFARISGGKSTVEAELTPQKIADITNKVSAEQAATDIANKVNAKTTAVANKQQAQAAEGIAKAQAQAQKVVDRRSQAIESKRFQRELSAYSKSIGKVPASDSEAFKKLQSGASAKDLLAEQKATVVNNIGDIKSLQDASAMTSEQPALHDIMQDVNTIAPETSVKQVTPSTGQREAQATVLSKTATPEGVEASRSIDMAKQNAILRDPNARASAKEIAQGRLDVWERRTPGPRDPNYLGPERRTVDVPRATQNVATISKVTTEPTAFEKLGIKVDSTSWKTPEDVVSGKKQAIQDLQTEGLKRATEISNGLKSGALTQVQSEAMKAQLKNDVSQALRSITKIKTPNVSRVARDRLRKGAEAFEANRVVGEQQAAAETTGRSVGSTTPSEEDSILQIDELVKKGFRSLNSEKLAKDILKEGDRMKLDNASKLQWLQTAFEELTKKGK